MDDFVRLFFIIELKREYRTSRLLYPLVAPTFAAYCNIAVVATDFNLRTFFNYIAGRVDAGVHYSFVSAIAGRFYLVYGVGDFEKTTRAFKEICLEVGTQTVADYIAPQIVNYTRQLIHLGCREELSLIDKIPVDQPVFFAVDSARHIVEIGVVVNPSALPFYPYARTYYITLFARVHNGF